MAFFFSLFDIQTHLDIWEQQSDGRQLSSKPSGSGGFVSLNAEIVSDTESPHLRNGLVDLADVADPVTAELVIKECTGRMQMRIPAAPDGPDRAWSSAGGHVR